MKRTLLVFILMGMISFSCTVSTKEYVAFYKNPSNGLRQIVENKGASLAVQYYSSGLKALSEGEKENTKTFLNRVKELDNYIIFELEVSGATSQMKNYLKQSAEQDIWLSSGEEQRFPVFYHKESNPMSSTEKVLLFFKRKKADTNYQLTLDQSEWFSKTIIEIEQENIEKSPQLNI